MDEESVEVSGLRDWHFRSAQWWFGLKNPLHAEDELGKIQPHLLDHPDVTVPIRSRGASGGSQNDRMRKVAKSG